MLSLVLKMDKISYIFSTSSLLHSGKSYKSYSFCVLDFLFLNFDDRVSKLVLETEYNEWIQGLCWVKLTIMQGRRKLKGKGAIVPPQILPEIEAKSLSSNGLLYCLPPPLIFRPSAISAVIRITFLVGKKVHSTTVCQNAFIFRLLSHFFYAQWVFF